MGAPETLARYQREWTAYLEAQDRIKLADAMRFVLSEFNQVPRRRTVASWMDLPLETILFVALAYQDCPQEQTKNVLAPFLATKVQAQEREDRRALQKKLQEIEAGNISHDIVLFMITALENIW